MLAVTVLAGAIAEVVRSTGGGDKTVQTVAGHKITEKDLELTVEHFHEEADREGKPFPAKDTADYKRVEEIALGLLVDQASIRAAAAKLGVQVTEAQVDAKASAPSGESEEGASKPKPPSVRNLSRKKTCTKFTRVSRSPASRRSVASRSGRRARPCRGQAGARCRPS